MRNVAVTGNGFHDCPHFCFNPLPDLRAFYLFFYLQQAAEYPEHISVHGRLRLIVRNAENGSGGVGSDPRQRDQVTAGIRRLSIIAGHDFPDPLLQVAGPRIVAQPLPGRQEVLLRRFRQGSNVRKPLQKPVIVGNDRFHAGLLQHDFRYPDAVRVAFLPPRQIPSHPVVPLQQPPCQRFIIHRPCCANRSLSRSLGRKEVVPPEETTVFLPFRAVSTATLKSNPMAQILTNKADPP